MSETLDIDEQPRKRIFLATTEEKGRNQNPSTLCLHNLLGHLGLHVGRSLDEILHHLVALLLAGSLDLLELLLGFLVRIVLGLLEPARVLIEKVVSANDGRISVAELLPFCSVATHLGLKLLVFLFLLVAVLLDLLLSLRFGVPYPLGAVCMEKSN